MSSINSVPARISIVTLGVADVERSARFYEALGWERRSSSIEGEIAWFKTADSYLGIFGWQALADDATMPDSTRGAFNGVTLAINVESESVVDSVLDAVVEAGASILKPAKEFGFGYGGYFADPDGHAWEVVFNRGFPIGPDGRITIP